MYILVMQHFQYCGISHDSFVFSWHCIIILFQPFHRKYKVKHNQCDIHVCMVHDGKVGRNTVEETMAFLHCNQLYFLWHSRDVLTIFLWNPILQLPDVCYSYKSCNYLSLKHSPLFKVTS